MEHTETYPSNYLVQNPVHPVNAQKVNTLNGDTEYNPNNTPFEGNGKLFLNQMERN